MGHLSRRTNRKWSPNSASFSSLFLLDSLETLLIWSPSLLLWQKGNVNWSVPAQSQKNVYFDKQGKVQIVHFIQIISFPNPNQAVLCWNLTKPQALSQYKVENWNMKNSHTSHSAKSQMFPSGVSAEPNTGKPKQDIGLTFIRWQPNVTRGKI